MTQPFLKIDSKQQPPDEVSDIELDSNGLNAEITVAPLDQDIHGLEEQVQQEQKSLDLDDFLSRSIQAFQASDRFFNTTIRPALEDSIKSYNSQHTSSSPYADGNSTIFRPKTRSSINKHVAAAKAAFFSNKDAVSIEAENPSDKVEVISASIMKSLINYRTRKSLKWAHIVLGGFKDALVQGLVCGHPHWDRIEHPSGKVTEKPVVDLIPLENIRFDESADWSDIVNSSPFLIVLQETFIGELKEALDFGYYGGVPTLDVSEDDIAASWNKDNENTKKERTNAPPGSTGPQTTKPSDYETVVVQLHIHRIGGQDWVWHTLNNERMLTMPVPIEEVYFHGRRPFVIGSYDIDPHNAYVTSLPTSLLPTQEEINVLANQRRTNVDMVMNRKWRVSPTAADQFDPQALEDNATGSIVFAAKDEIEPLAAPDVTQSSYQEQMALDKDFNDLAGDYNPQAPLAQGSRNPSDAYKTHEMLNAAANQLVEYRIGIYAITFIEPLLRQLCLLEQFYETDEVIVGLAGQMAGMFQRINGQVQWTRDADKISGAPSASAGPPNNNVSAPSINPGAPGVASPGMGGPAPNPMGGQPPNMGGPVQPHTQGQQPDQHLPPGISIESLLSRELTILVNVGLNATDPMLKQQRLGTVVTELKNLGMPPQAFDLLELGTEMFGLAGYGDGKRFLNQNVDPNVMALMAENMALKKQLADKQTKEKVKASIENKKITSKERIEAAKLRQDAAKELLEHSREADALQHAKDQAAKAQQSQPIQPPEQPIAQQPIQE